MPTGRERNRARRKHLADDEIRTRGPELKEVSERTRKNNNERTKEMIEKQQKQANTGIKVIRPLIVFLTEMDYE